MNKCGVFFKTSKTKNSSSFRAFLCTSHLLSSFFHQKIVESEGGHDFLASKINIQKCRTEHFHRWHFTNHVIEGSTYLPEVTSFESASQVSPPQAKNSQAIPD